MFPLICVALPGCFEVILNPYNEHAVKNLYILFIHIAPFLWIPYDLSIGAVRFSVAILCLYIIFIFVIGENPIHIYDLLLKENHPTAQAFVRDRFGG